MTHRKFRLRTLIAHNWSLTIDGHIIEYSLFVLILDVGNDIFVILYQFLVLDAEVIYLFAVFAACSFSCQVEKIAGCSFFHFMLLFFFRLMRGLSIVMLFVQYALFFG
ncbi:hypothetical protein ACJX0J_007489 [Zea mays]